MILYSLRTLTPNHHTIAKFDDDFNVAAVYNLHPKGHDYTCDCPANSRTVILRPCKHRRMLPLLLAKADPNAFLDFDTGQWHQPLGDLLRPEAGDLAGREAMPDEPPPPFDVGDEGLDIVKAVEEVYGKSPLVEDYVPAMKEYNALMGEALGSSTPAQPAQATIIRRR